MRKFWIILLSCCCSLASAGELSVSCGDWVELRAADVPDWHFERWSDGSTEAVRQVEVTGNLNYTAFYAPNCGAYAQLPVVSLYEWLLMLDVQSLQQQGYRFGPEQVRWFRVNGEADDPQQTVGNDDTACGTGYYLTLDRALPGTGDYYAVVDVSKSPAGLLCHDVMRTEIVRYASEEATERRVPVLEPTLAGPGATLQLKRLDPQGQTTVTVSDMAGKTLQQFQVENADHASLQAASLPGTYQVVVVHGNERIVLRYIVAK